jgi:hypothetical protein
MPKIKSKKAEEILKPLDDLIKDIQKHTDDGVDCLERAREDIAKNIKNYLDDIEKRVRFFRDWHSKSPNELGKKYPKICDAFMRQVSEYHIAYITWLFAFCFSNQEKSFEELLKERQK